MAYQNVAEENLRALQAEDDDFFGEFVSDTKAGIGGKAGLVGIGAGILFGPAAGLLLGIMTASSEGQDERAQKEAKFAANLALEGLDAEMDGWYEDALNRYGKDHPNHEQVVTLKTQYDAARAMMNSPNPEVSKKGAELLASNMSAQTSFVTKNEEQEIAAQAAELQLEREMGTETYNRHKDLNKRYDTEVEDYRLAEAKARTAKELLARKTAHGDMTAVKLIEQLVNTGTVLLSEQATYRQAGGWEDFLAATRQAAIDGTLQDEARLELYGIINMLERDYIAEHNNIKSRYHERAEDAGIPVKYWDNYDAPEMPGGQYTEASTEELEKRLQQLRGQ